jgi:hypothetical protein
MISPEQLLNVKLEKIFSGIYLSACQFVGIEYGAGHQDSHFLTQNYDPLKVFLIFTQVRENNIWFAVEAGDDPYD